jgi:hypothetical protein
MGILDKLRAGQEAGAAVAPAAASGNFRQSNGLKDFLWLLGEVERGRVLDLGPVSQSTVSFFTSRGFKFHSEDLLYSWRNFMRDREEALRRAAPGTRLNNDPARLAEDFVAAHLRFESESLHGVLAWDVFDMLEQDALPLVVKRLFDALRPSGVLLGIFHNRAPERPSRYRVLDNQHIELVPHDRAEMPRRFLQNRDILNLFSAFRSSKTYVARDQIREGLFTK